ncbi:membrane protein insertase YidC [Paucibacter sp. APW11]|uniref:Membrane protein insertase YidC n=1 Tax=Roseateles aquae TaxID=3077235 RepID=A0ABU3PIF1_9BURK|nr:membrane protein insertase YidC [Paucibacter sp. APW11]MDT9002340.1 membrane protein insertase YidC [Paucibacter sp. APW11]
MTDIRRTVLWVVFTMSLVLLWDGWQKHNGHPSMFSPAATKPVAAAAPGAASAPLAAGAPAAATAAAAGASAPLVSELVTISTDVLKVMVDSKGGDVVRVELPKYKATNDAGVIDTMKQLVGLQAKPVDEDKPIVLLDPLHGYKAQSGLVGANGEQLPNHATLMTVVAGERELKDGQNELSLRLESPEVGGVKLVKTYTFKRGEYLIGVKHELVNAGAAAVTPQVYVQLVRDGAPAPGANGFYATFNGPAVYTDKSKFRKVEFADIDKDNVDIEKRANEGWAAMVQHYFTSAWLHTEAAQRDFFVRKLPSAGTPLYATGMVFTLPPLAAGASTQHQDQLYVGPQEEKRLAELAPGLELVKDYGWFTIISKPLFWLLDQLHTLIGNWGWAIIALVVLLKVALYGLNASAYRSMAKMKAINPKIMEMRERLKDKPQEMQQEMMRIYREEKVNPIGSCLPMLLQMPIFIALYYVLLSSVEMRGAPWLGWIVDLSVKDPFFILPILMTISSLFQVWLNPAPADPTQAKMMWIMPLAFSFMFFAFPAGLTLYYVVNNVLSIAQQWVINKHMGVQN